jgi:hypothetical protein
MNSTLQHITGDLILLIQWSRRGGCDGLFMWLGRGKRPWTENFGGETYWEMFIWKTKKEMVDSIKMDFREVGWEDQIWMELVYFIVTPTTNVSWASLKRSVMKGRGLDAKHSGTHVPWRRGVKNKFLRRNNASWEITRGNKIKDRFGETCNWERKLKVCVIYDG